MKVAFIGEMRAESKTTEFMVRFKLTKLVYTIVYEQTELRLQIIVNLEHALYIHDFTSFKFDCVSHSSTKLASENEVHYH